MAAIRAHAKRSLAQTFLTGLILTAVPLLSLAGQEFTGAEDRILTLPAIVSSNGLALSVQTDLNTLDLERLAGTDNLTIGDIVYVHIEARPGQTPYPFAISQNRPKLTDESAVMLRGVVQSRGKQSVKLHYLFEELPQNNALFQAVTERATPAKIDLAVNARAVGKIQAVTVGKARYPLPR